MNKNKSIFLWIASGVIVLLIVAIVVFVFRYKSTEDELLASQTTNEQLNNQLRQSLANELDAIKTDYENFENSENNKSIQDSTLLVKYTAAKDRVEQLIQELNSEKKKSQKQIADLQKEISTLRGLLKHYIAENDSLRRENEGYKEQNEEIRNQNRNLTSRVEEVSRQNATLNERMTLAEKLNVTNVTLTPLNKKDKTEKNITKAKRLLVSFTIPQNNSTPVGNKTIYLRITSPEGTLVGNDGNFDFEGASVPCSAKKTIEYTGEEITNLQIYCDFNNTLTAGTYTVELFADNFKLTSKQFTLKK